MLASMDFDVAPDQIARLSDEDLRSLVGRLCEAEVRSRGHAPVGVTYGGDQNAPDGGIDVRAEVPAEAAVGFVPRSITGFQVKAEDMPRASIREEMRRAGRLRPSIAELGARGGAYIIVSSKGSVADGPLADRLAAMRDAAADDPSADGLHLDFYDRRRVATWVNGHPAEIAWVRQRVGERLSGWRPFEDWSSAPDAIGTPYLLDGGVRLVAARAGKPAEMTAEDGIAMLRSLLRQPGGVVRLVGLSGVGKTRLVQALFDAKVGTEALDQTAVVYADVGDGPKPAPLDLLLRLKAAGRFSILVLDNCGSDLHARVAKRVRQGAAPVSLLTVEYDLREDEPEGTDVFRMEPASAQVIEAILERKHPDLTAVERGAIASFSEGNSRIALALAATATNGGSLANLGDRQLFERLFRQQQADDPGLLRAASVLALVHSFDGETVDRPDADLSILASLAGVGAEELRRYVAELRRRQLVQCRAHWRALLPHALAHRLAKVALQDIAPPVLKSRLVDRADERLLKSFSRRLGQLHDSVEAQAIVAGWLSEGGLLGDISTLNDLGRTLLDNIAPVDPAAVLRAISRAMKAGAETLSRTEQQTHRVARLLRAVAYDPQHFDEAITLLGSLAAGRKESNDTADARNVFTSMFHLYLSGTHAPAQQRADALRALVRSDDAWGADLALAGLDAMLECDHFSSGLDFEFGSRKRDYGLYPTGPAVADWFNTAVRLAAELDLLPHLRAGVRQAVGRRLRGLALNTGAHDQLAVLVRHFAAHGGWVEGWTQVKAAERAARKGGRAVETETLEALARILQPSSLDDLVAVYALNEDVRLLDLEDDDLDGDGISCALARLDERQRGLGCDLARAPDAVTRLLPRLVRQGGSGVGPLGQELGRTVGDPRPLWTAIVRQIESAGVDAPVGGFAASVLSGIAAREPDLAAEALDEVLETPMLHRFLVQFQIAAGLDDRGLDRLVAAAGLPSVPTSSFRMLAWGGVTLPIEGARLRDLLRALAEREDGISSAVEILRMRLYGLSQAGITPTPADREAGRFLVERALSDHANRGLEDIVAACLVPGEDDGTARRFCARLRLALAAHQAKPWEVGEVIAALGRGFPRAVLDVFVGGRVTEVDDFDAAAVERHASRGGFLGQVGDEVVLAWAREDAGGRFQALARVIPLWKKADQSNSPGTGEDGSPLEWSPVALRLLDEAPNPALLTGILEERLYPCSWGGSLAAILAERARSLEALVEHQKIEVSAWARLAKGRLEDAAAREREQEAAESRERDQRFDW